VMYTGIVYDSPTDSLEISRGRCAQGKGGTQTDSLIIIVNYGRMWGLGGLVCVVLSGFPLQGVY
jgi:hypothetical protein